MINVIDNSKKTTTLKFDDLEKGKAYRIVGAGGSMNKDFIGSIGIFASCLGLGLGDYFVSVSHSPGTIWNYSEAIDKFELEFVEVDLEVIVKKKG